MLHGVDVHARYQAGLVASTLPDVDFVVTKASGGTSLVIDGWEGMLAGASLTGVYHYAREKGRAGSAAEESANFIVQANKVPDAVLFLDWEESSSDLGDASWVLEWMHLVEEGTGRRPVLYTYHAVLAAHPDLAQIQAAGYQLWYARYPYSSAVGWKDYDAPTVPIWDSPTMWQYSSAGGIDGYAGALDLNIFYGDAADWRSLAAHTQKEESMTAEQTRQAVIATGRSLKGTLSYSNQWVGATLAQIKARKSGDCSDFTQAIFGAHGYHVGAMSYQQALNGVEVASYTGPASGSVAAFNRIKSNLKTADIICMAIDPARPGKVSHVEIFTETIPITLGHGSGTGPKEQDVRASWLLGKATFWTVRRIIPDDKPGTAPETATIDDFEEVIGEMKATHIIFERNGAIGIANVLAGTYQMMKTTEQFKDRVTVLKQAGAKVVEWRHLRQNPDVSKPNVVDNLDAWGQKI